MSGAPPPAPMPAVLVLPGLERVPTGITLETPPAGCFVVLDIVVDGDLATPGVDDAPPTGHHTTLAKAHTALADSDGADAPPIGDRVITRLLSPCVTLSCQCGAYTLGEDDEETPASELHFETFAAASEYAAENDMTVAGTPGGEYLVFDADQSCDQRHRHRFDCASLNRLSQAGRGAW